MANDFYVEFYRFGLTGGKSLYAILRDSYGNALRFGGSSWALDEYTKLTHDDFAIVMEEHGQFTGVWSKRLLNSVINLPFNEGTDRYTVEIWEEASAGVRDRDEDTFVTAYTYSYQELISTRYEAQVQVGYDHLNSRFSVWAWVDVDGDLLDSVNSMTITVKDSANQTVLTLSSSSPDADGMFYMSESDVTLSPDEVYKTIIQFTDPNSVTHKQVVGGTAWD